MKNISLRNVVLMVAMANLAYFFVEYSIAIRIGSVSLFADSIDFLEDTAINVIIAIALGWSAMARSRFGMLLALILLVPGIATLYAAWQKFLLPVAPDAAILSLTGLGALAVNISCALLLSTFRKSGDSLTKAAFLSARNDSIANLLIISAGLVTAYVWQNGWPDLVVGLVIAGINADAAFEVWEAAKNEHGAADRSGIA
jgi:Co/Zn/Cd efflux system component